jgi:hypothetical protein
VYGACSTKPDTAAELRASQAQGVAKVPQQRGIGVAVEGVCYAVYLELNCVCHIVATDEFPSDRLTSLIMVSVPPSAKALRIALNTGTQDDPARTRGFLTTMVWSLRSHQIVFTVLDGFSDVSVIGSTFHAI